MSGLLADRSVVGDQKNKWHIPAAQSLITEGYRYEQDTGSLKV